MTNEELAGLLQDALDCKVSVRDPYWHAKAQMAASDLRAAHAEPVAMVEVGGLDWGPFIFRETPYGADHLETGTTKLYARSQAPSGWVSVKERLPERGAVLVWCPARKNTYSAIRAGDVWRHFGNSPHEMTEEPSHWMPLPAPPRSEEG